MPKHTITSPTQSKIKRSTPNTKKTEINETRVASEGQYSLSASQTWITIAKCALELNQYNYAIVAYDNSLRHHPDDVESLLGLSKALKLSLNKQEPLKNIHQARDLIISSIQKFPNLSNDTLVWKELADTHLEAKEFEQAHQAISRALSINGNDPGLLLIASECLIKASNSQIASHNLQNIINILSYRPQLSEKELDIIREAHYKLAYIAFLENDFNAATEQIQKVLSLQPPPPSRIEEFASYWNFLVVDREITGDLDGAFNVIHDAINSLGHIPKLQSINAYLLLIPNTKYYDPIMAVNLLERAYNQEKLSQNLRFNLTTISNTNISPSSSADEAGDFILWYLLGKAYSIIDSRRQAYDAFQVALRKGPSSPLPWLAVGSLYLHMGQLPDSLAAYSQAARLLADDNSVSSAAASAAAWDGLACVYERCNDQAIDAADACIRAASCFRAAGNLNAAVLAEQRGNALNATARGDASPPPLRDPSNAPIDLLRVLILQTPNEQRLSNQYQLITQEEQVQAQTLKEQQQPPQHNEYLSRTGSIQQAQTHGSQHQNDTPGYQQHLSPRNSNASQLSVSKVSTPIEEHSKQFHHLPLPRGSIAGRTHSSEAKSTTQGRSGIVPSQSQAPPSIQQRGSQNSVTNSHWSPHNENVKTPRGSGNTGSTKSPITHYYYGAPDDSNTPSSNRIFPNGSQQGNAIQQAQAHLGQPQGYPAHQVPGAVNGYYATAGYSSAGPYPTQPLPQHVQAAQAGQPPYTAITTPNGYAPWR
ncbi:hypothetical protein WICMUC_004320 [Wickerhamomyces mucosus]|uniref:Uncharacterized protein n=1 Tax=Wickerhamomyces mucosus TaxID=1378264 RepID=A0A9P8TAE5_9ASCO|nr:hypothetical protein WICMUC_004320 [Wickerhamomyces mucosus]